MKKFSRKLAIVLLAMSMAVCTAVGITSVAAEGGTLTVTSAETLSGKAGFGISLTDAQAPAESDALTVYVDSVRVYNGPYAESFELDTTQLSNGESRTLKAELKLSDGSVLTGEKKIRIENAQAGVDPVRIYTPEEMSAGFSTTENATKEVVNEGGTSYLKFTTTADNGNIRDWNIHVNLGSAEAPRNPVFKIKLKDSGEDLSYDVRMLVWGASDHSGAAYDEKNHDYIANTCTETFLDFDIRTGAKRHVSGNCGNVPEERATVYGEDAWINLMFANRKTGSLYVEYFVIESYPNAPIAVVDGSPKCEASEKSIDKYSLADVVFAIDANGHALVEAAGPFDAEGNPTDDTAITAADYTLTNGTSGSETLTIKKEYIAQLSTGEKYFTVSNGSGEVTVHLTVTDTTPAAITSVAITNKLETAKSQATHKFEYTVDPDNATNYTHEWTSSDDGVAIINADTGEAKFLSSGHVTITLKVIDAYDSEFTDSCEIDVVSASIAPVITAPVNYAQVRGGLLMAVERQVNDENAVLSKMNVRFDGTLIYSGEYKSALGIDTSVFENGKRELSVEFVLGDGTNSIARRTVILANDVILTPTLEDMAVWTRENGSPTVERVEDMDGNLTGITIQSSDGGFANVYSSRDRISLKDPASIRVTVSVTNIVAKEGAEAAKARIRMVLPGASRGNDFAVLLIYDILEPGVYSLCFDEILEREMASGDRNRMNDDVYSYITGNEDVIYYLTLDAEFGAAVTYDYISLEKDAHKPVYGMDAYGLSQHIVGGKLTYKVNEADFGTLFVATAPEGEGDYVQSEATEPKAVFTVDFGSEGSLNEVFATVKAASASVPFDVRFKVEGETDYDWLFAGVQEGGTKSLRYNDNGIDRTAYTGVKKVYCYIALRGAGVVEFESISVGAKLGDSDEVGIDGLVSAKKAPVLTGDAAVEYDKYLGGELSFEIDGDGLELSVSGGYIPHDGYRTEGTKLVFEESYLSALEVGEYTYEVSNGVGSVSVTVKVIDTRPAAPEVKGSDKATYDRSAPTDASFEIELHGAAATVKGNGITANDYTLENGVLTFRKEFLAGLSLGERTFTVTTDGGTVSVKVEITDNGSAQDEGCGGCGGSAGVGVGMTGIMLLSALALKKKIKA